MAAAKSGASAQSQNKLTAPTWGTITRDNGTRLNLHDQKLNLNWTAVTGATGYNVVCSDTDGWSWWQCGSITSGSTTTLTVDNYADGSDLERSRDYKVGVRAVNSNPAQASNWTNSANIRRIRWELDNLTSTRGNGTITLSWTPNLFTTGYQIHCAEADMTPPYSASVYTLCATLTGQVDTAASHSVTIPHSTNSTYTIDNTKTYDIKIISTNQWGQSDGWFAPLVLPLSVGASNVGQTTAKLTVANYTRRVVVQAHCPQRRQHLPQRLRRHDRSLPVQPHGGRRLHLQDLRQDGLQQRRRNGNGELLHRVQRQQPQRGVGRLRHPTLMTPTT